MNMEKIFLSQADRLKRRHGIIVITILIILIVIAFIISMNTGLVRLSPKDVIYTLLGKGTANQSLVLFDFRLPRIVISILIGAGLAASGCILQGVSRNALADPGILGMNAGAGLMVMLFIAFFPSTSTAPVFMLPLIALIGAGITALLIYSLAYRRQHGLSPTSLLLTGIGISAGIAAAMIVLTLKLSPEKYKFVSSWLAGSIWGTSWKFVLALLPWIVVILPFVFYKARVLNIVNLGQQTATGLGTPVQKEQFLLLAAAVGLAGPCVAVSGSIGFVGLIAPHLGRRLVGPRHEILLPTSALVGALLVLVADMLGRIVLQPTEVPTGIVVAVIGAPYFLYLLARSKT